MKRIIRIILQLILPALIILGSIFIVRKMIEARPPQKSKEAAKVIPSLNVETFQSATHSPPIESFGVVQSKFSIELKPLVTGRIVEVASEFEVGNRISKGTILVKIDKTDFLSAKAQAEFNLDQAKFQLTEENVLAEQAAGDWQASGRDIKDAPDYLLRKPQIKAATSRVTAMTQAVEKATKDLERTEIKAPFNAIVSSRTASLGGLASQQEVLGILVSTESVEVQLPLQKDQLERLPSFSKDSPLEVTLSSPLRKGITWKASLGRLAPLLDEANQTANAIAEIKNPYAQDSPPLPIGTFVDAKLSSKALEQCFAVPNAAIVNDQFVWSVSTAEGKSILQKKKVFRILSNEDTSFIRIKQHEAAQAITLVTRPLANLKDGLEISPVTK